MYRFTLCALLGAAIVVLSSSSPAAAFSQKFTTQRADGSSLYWSLDLPDTQSDKVGLVVIMQGSGCEPVAKNKSLMLARAAFPDFAAVTADKYGINPNADFEWSDTPNCEQAYYAKSTNSQRVADYRQILDGLSSARWWDGQLVLVGGSEGGDIAARLSALIRPDAVVLISTGGGSTFGETVRASVVGEMERNSVPRDQWPDIDETFTQARENPESAEVRDGYSLKYWADSIDHKAVEDMLRTAAPILLVHGTGDTSAPLYTARAAVDAFTKEKRCNLTYWEKTSYDHAMVDADGNDRLKEVLIQAASWVHNQLKQPSRSTCMKPQLKIDHN